MKLNTKTVSIAALAIVAVLSIGFVFKQSASRAAATNTATASSSTANPTNKEGSPKTIAQLELLASDVITLNPRSMVNALALTGSVRAVNTTVAKSKVAGDLQQLLVREGQSVQQGQLIARMDATEYELRLKDRQAQLQSAQAALVQARRNYDNNRQLKDQGFISQNGFDNTQSALDIAKANLDSAVANLNLAKRALDDTSIRASMAGVVGERFAQQGEKLAIDGRILSIVDTRTMELEAVVPAYQIEQVQVGAKVTLQVEGSSQTLNGQVVRIAPSTQSGTRSIAVYISVDNTQGSARAGVFAQARLELNRMDNALALPATAVRTIEGRSTVFVVDKNAIVEVPVKTGFVDQSGLDSVVQITQGLSQGAVVVRQPGANVVAGLPVVFTSTGATNASASQVTVSNTVPASATKASN